MTPPPAAMTAEARAALAREIARAILSGFEGHYRLFSDITQRARANFEQCRWQQQDEISQERLFIYDKKVRECVRAIGDSFDTALFDEPLWEMCKRDYISLTTRHSQPELAETFYNSIFCALFAQQYYRNRYIFFRPHTSTAYIDLDAPVVASYYTDCAGLPAALSAMFDNCGFECGYEDRARDAMRVAEQIIAQLNLADDIAFEIQSLKPVFFRQKAAYIIGRIALSETRVTPLVIAFFNEPGRGVFVDAVVTDNESIANIVSFSRSYFFVKTPYPAAVVDFVKEVIPAATKADLYSAIGLHKHGKNLLYRLFVKKSRVSSEKLVISPGIPGTVMTVFTFNTFPYVFKVINDKFAPPKTVTHKIVREKYHFVKRHAKIGRLADTWEFSNVAFPIDMVDDELLAQLKSSIPSCLEVRDESVLIRHLYMENKMTPLNLYLNRADDAALERIIRDFGRAIEELISAGIFPGDMLTKNFGVTEQNRVVFYDYDEITPMDVPVFRRIPPPRTIEDEFAAEPWYPVGEHDVFPEEFGVFLTAHKKLRQIFTRLYPHLLDYKFWQRAQDDIRQKKQRHFYPYKRKYRLGALYR